MRRGSSSSCLVVRFRLFSYQQPCRYPQQKKKRPLLHPINLNTATAAELQQVRGTRPSSSAKVLKVPKPAALSSLHDLRAIKGIGPRRTEKCASI
jgi:DNA uptake protein ComE-like DNA-binding protein